MNAIETMTVRYWPGIIGGTAVFVLWGVLLSGWAASGILLAVKAGLFVADVVLIARLVRARVVLTPRGVTAYNILRTWHWDWREVSGFEITWYWQVVACLAGGRRRWLDALTPFGMPVGPIRANLDRIVQELNSQRERWR